MRRTTQLRNLLSDMTAVFNDGERCPVEFDKGNYAKPDGTVVVAPNVRDTIGRDLSGPQELRVIVDSLSHEVEHVRESVLTAKKDFMDDYNTRHAKLAGSVINIVEDAYIDWNRGQRFPGMRRAHAFWVDANMENARRRPSMANIPREQQIVEGVWQVAHVGKVRGIADADDDVQAFFAYTRKKMDAARRHPDPSFRESVARDITDYAVNLLPDDYDQNALENYMDAIPTDEIPEDAGSDYAPETRDMPDDAPTQTVEVDTDGTGDASEVEAGDDDAGDESGESSSSGSDADTTDSNDDPTGDDADDAGDAGDDSDDAGDSSLPDDLQNELDEMLENDDGKSGDWHDIDGDEDYSDPSELDEKRYDNLQDAIESAKSDIGQMKKDRDEAMEKDNSRWNTGHDDIRREAEGSGMIDDIVDAFRKFKTRDRDLPSTAGSSLNIRNVIRNRAGDFNEKRLYNRRQQAEVGDRAVVVSVDFSGSMWEKNAKIAIAALAEATRIIGDDFAAATWTTNSRKKDPIENSLVTAPDESFDYRHLDAVSTGGSTPTANGIKFARSIAKDMFNREKVIIVVTDGKPNETLDLRGDYDWSTLPDDHPGFPADDARKQIAAARRDGIRVIGLGVGSVKDETMAFMFGERGYVKADMSNLADTLVEVYRQQMRVAQNR